MNKSHRDIKPERIVKTKDLINRIEKIGTEKTQYIERIKEPESFFDRLKQITLRSIIEYIRNFTSVKADLNLDKFVRGKSDKLILKLSVYITGYNIFDKEIPLL